MGEYNPYQWNPNLGGSTEEQYIRNAYNNAGRFANQLGNFNSSFYQQYASYLNKAIPGVGTNAFLPTLTSGGGNYAGGMSQALKLKENAMRGRQDAMNTGIQGFASSNVGQITNLLGLQGDVSTSAYATKTQKEIADSQQGGWLDALGSIVGTVGGIALAPMTMGASMIPTAMNLFGNSGGGERSQNYGNYGWTGQGFNYGQRK